MCYSILYKKLFVRLPDDTFILFVQSGDSNVWTTNTLTGRDERSRSWSAIFLGDVYKPSYSRDEIAAWLDKQRADAVASAAEAFKVREDPYRKATPEADVNARFGFYSAIAVYGKSCSTTSWATFRRFFEDGIKNAMPADEFLANVSGIRLEYYEKTESGDDTRFARSEPYRSVDELLKAVSEYRANRGGMPWLAPSSPYATGAVADAVASVTTKGWTVRLQSFPAFRPSERSYIESLIPFRTTEEKGRAARFKREFVMKTNCRYLLSLLNPGHQYDTISCELAG